MRSGKPCIGSPGAPAEIVRHEETGFIVEQPDRAALATACVRLFADDALAARMGEAGRERAAESFSVTAFRTRLRTLLGVESRS
jgi:glycosyltransferase involved in cell wall biosynthesis